jgi:uncharacterized protein
MSSADEKQQSGQMNAPHSMFKALEQAIVVDRHRTLEDLTREMLLPMLKTWLDENLPTVVERLVRAEIDRVSKPRSHASSANSESTE